jgi:hypothetical protein
MVPGFYPEEPLYSLPWQTRPTGEKHPLLTTPGADGVLSAAFAWQQRFAGAIVPPVDIPDDMAPRMAWCCAEILNISCRIPLFLRF